MNDAYRARIAAFKADPNPLLSEIVTQRAANILAAEGVVRLRDVLALKRDNTLFARKGIGRKTVAVISRELADRRIAQGWSLRQHKDHEASVKDARCWSVANRVFLVSVDRKPVGGCFKWRLCALSGGKRVLAFGSEIDFSDAQRAGVIHLRMHVEDLARLVEASRSAGKGE